MDLADIIMEVFAMESSFLRSKKIAARGKTSVAEEMCTVFLRDAMARIELSARNVLGACSSPNAIRLSMQVLRRLAAYDPVDSVALRRSIAKRLLERQRYAL